jgi:hypothetical protein
MALSRGLGAAHNSAMLPTAWRKEWRIGVAFD